MSIGTIVGVIAGLVLLKAAVHHRHRHHAWGGAGCSGRAGWGGGPPWARHGHGHGHSHHRGRGPGAWMWGALGHLDLSPAQEKVVRTEAKALADKARALKDEGARSRADMARAVAGEEFEEGALASMFIRHDDVMRGLREDLAGALGRIHTVLDPAQRERLAELLERGRRGPLGGGPYRV